MLMVLAVVMEVKLSRPEIVQLLNAKVQIVTGIPQPCHANAIPLMSGFMANAERLSLALPMNIGQELAVSANMATLGSAALVRTLTSITIALITHSSME